jgi:lipopolysaccharide heptosyltransferase II
VGKSREHFFYTVFSSQGNFLKTQFLKFVDKFVGRALVCCLSSPRFDQKHPVNKILFIRPGGIGDAVLLIPVLELLEKQYPEAVIDVLAEKRNATVFKMCSIVRHVLLYDQGALLKVLRSNYDVVIDTEQWHRLTAVVTRLIKSGTKIGYGTNERKKLYTHVVNYRHDRYELDSFYDLLQPLGIDRPDVLSVPFLTIPTTEQESAQKLLGRLSECPYIVLFPGASIPERRWGAEKFHQLAVKLSEYGSPVVVVGGQEDCDAGDEILSGVDGLNLAGKTSLVGSAAVVEKAALLVSGDSGMLHIGVGLGRPTVSLFGSGIAAKWAPQGENHVVLNKELPCSPCTRFGYTPPCSIGVKCLEDISVEDVHAAVVTLVGLTE